MIWLLPNGVTCKQVISNTPPGRLSLSHYFIFRYFCLTVHLLHISQIQRQEKCETKKRSEAQESKTCGNIDFNCVYRNLTWIVLNVMALICFGNPSMVKTKLTMNYYQLVEFYIVLHMSLWIDSVVKSSIVFIYEN